MRPGFPAFRPQTKSGKRYLSKTARRGFKLKAVGRLQILLSRKKTVVLLCFSCMTSGLAKVYIVSMCLFHRQKLIFFTDVLNT